MEQITIDAPKAPRCEENRAERPEKVQQFTFYCDTVRPTSALHSSPSVGVQCTVPVRGFYKRQTQMQLRAESSPLHVPGQRDNFVWRRAGIRQLSLSRFMPTSIGVRKIAQSTRHSAEAVNAITNAVSYPARICRLPELPS